MSSLLLRLHLLHASLFLHVHCCQLLHNPVVDLKELGNTAVQADSFSLGQFSLTVSWWNAFAVATSGQPGMGNTCHVTRLTTLILATVSILTCCTSLTSFQFPDWQKHLAYFDSFLVACPVGRSLMICPWLINSNKSTPHVFSLVFLSSTSPSSLNPGHPHNGCFEFSRRGHLGGLLSLQDEC